MKSTIMEGAKYLFTILLKSQVYPLYYPLFLPDHWFLELAPECFYKSVLLLTILENSLKSKEKVYLCYPSCWQSYVFYI